MYLSLCVWYGKKKRGQYLINYILIFIFPGNSITRIEANLQNAQKRFSLRIQDSMATSHSKLKAINSSYHINSLISNCRWILALHFSL